MKMETQNRGLKSYLFGDKAFYKAVFAIVVPIIIQNLITSFVSLLDNVMVGQLGTAQMSGVAIANQLIFIFNICIFGGISGASIYGAQFYGSGDYEGMRAAMLAPTATNQQKFRFELLEDGSLKISRGLGFYSKMDLGIVKYHFELGSGKKIF